MDWAGFSHEARPEFIEYVLDSRQDSPEAVRALRIVRGVRCVLIERNGIGYFNGHLPDMNIDSRGVEHAHDFPVEVSDGARREWKRLDNAVAGVKRELVIDEVERELEGPAAVWDQRC